MVDRTNWERLDKMTDEEIDVSDIPPLDEDFWREATLRMPQPKKMVSIRLDEEVIVWFKHLGSGYQTRMNAVLKAYMTSSMRSAATVAQSRATRVSTNRRDDKARVSNRPGKGP